MTFNQYAAYPTAPGSEPGYIDVDTFLCRLSPEERKHVHSMMDLHIIAINSLNGEYGYLRDKFYDWVMKESSKDIHRYFRLSNKDQFRFEQIIDDRKKAILQREYELLGEIRQLDEN